jgi:hypothetical protein
MLGKGQVTSKNIVLTRQKDFFYRLVRSKEINHKLSKTLWGLLAFSPWILFFIGVPILIHQVPPDSIMMTEGKLTPFLIGFLVVVNLYVLLLFLIFLIYLGRLWRGLMFFGHVFTIPVFWYFYIWKEDK